jgi:hypothetical protein
MSQARKEYQRILSVIRTGDVARIDAVLKHVYGTQCQDTIMAAQNLVMAGYLSMDDDGRYSLRLGQDELENLRRLHAQVEAFARQDMEIARKRGAASIVDTQMGIVELRYNAQYRNYSLYRVGDFGDEAHVVTHAAKGMSDFLARLVYEVTYAA